MPWPEDSVPKTFYPFPWIFHSFIPSAMSLSLGGGGDVPLRAKHSTLSYSQPSAVSLTQCKKKLL